MITASERRARQVYASLPWRSKDVVREWLATGHSLRDAILNSNVLGTGELRTPRDARREAIYANDQRQASEHESAHICVAAAVGLDAKYAKISSDGSGECGFVKGVHPCSGRQSSWHRKFGLTNFGGTPFRMGLKGCGVIIKPYRFMTYSSCARPWIFALRF